MGGYIQCSMTRTEVFLTLVQALDENTRTGALYFVRQPAHMHVHQSIRIVAPGAWTPPRPSTLDPGLMMMTRVAGLKMTMIPIIVTQYIFTRFTLKHVTLNTRPVRASFWKGLASAGE